jgi:hypothetical protein
MSGIRYLFISNNNVFKIPTPKDRIYKPIPQLANQDVLEIILYYETINRKPNKLLFISFDRMQLDNHGQYILTQEEINKGSRNFLLFAFQTPEILSKSDKPLPIPSTITIPTKSEKVCLKQYLKEYMPHIYTIGLHIIEKEIQTRNENNIKNIQFVKDAAKIRTADKR